MEDESPTIEQSASVLRKLQKWADYPSIGKPVAHFIPCKTPLSKEFLCDRALLPSPPKHALTVEHLLHSQKQEGRRVGFIIDLSNHACLYEKDIPPDIEYHHVRLVAKVIPPPEFVTQVREVAEKFLEEHPDEYIAIHCAYGFNRTGFVVTSCLCEMEGMSVMDALKAFAASRPPGVKHEVFMDELFRRYSPGQQPCHPIPPPSPPARTSQALLSTTPPATALSTSQVPGCAVLSGAVSTSHLSRAGASTVTSHSSLVACDTATLPVTIVAASPASSAANTPPPNIASMSTQPTEQAQPVHAPFKAPCEPIASQMPVASCPSPQVPDPGANTLPPSSTSTAAAAIICAHKPTQAPHLHAHTRQPKLALARHPASSHTGSDQSPPHSPHSTPSIGHTSPQRRTHSSCSVGLHSHPRSSGPQQPHIHALAHISSQPHLHSSRQQHTQTASAGVAAHPCDTAVPLSAEVIYSLWGAHASTHPLYDAFKSCAASETTSIAGSVAGTEWLHGWIRGDGAHEAHQQQQSQGELHLEPLHQALSAVELSELPKLHVSDLSVGGTTFGSQHTAPGMDGASHDCQGPESNLQELGAVAPLSSRDGGELLRGNVALGGNQGSLHDLHDLHDLQDLNPVAPLSPRDGGVLSPPPELSGADKGGAAGNKALDRAPSNASSIGDWLDKYLDQQVVLSQAVDGELQGQQQQDQADGPLSEQQGEGQQRHQHRQGSAHQGEGQQRQGLQSEAQGPIDLEQPGTKAGFAGSREQHGQR